VLRRLLRAGVSSTALLLACAGAASAAVTSSNITSPSGTLYLQASDDPPTPVQTAVTGTSNGSPGDPLDIRCWFGNGSSVPLAGGVLVGAGGAFSATAALSKIDAHACRLRAAPTASNESAAFAGPRIAVSEFETTGQTSDVVQNGPNAGALVDYVANGVTFSGFGLWDSAGACGARLNTIDASYAQAIHALDCGGTLLGSDGFSRSEIQVDGNNAYDVQGAADLIPRSGGCPPTCVGSQDNPGLPTLAVSQAWNSTNGLESTSTTEGIVECPPPDSFQPPNQVACPSFTPAGVALHRSTTMLSSNQIEMTDTWSSTDGHAHVVSALYDDEATGSGGGAGFQFAGASGFSRQAPGDVLPGGASAPGSILVHSNVNAPDGDPSEQYAAITFSTSPSQFVFSAGNQFSEHQAFAVPAGGPATIQYIYSTGTSLEQVQALALAAQDELKSPAVAIVSPPSGTRVKLKSIRVWGTTGAGSGIRSVTVKGRAASIGMNGIWSVRVPVAPGTNTITATATSNAGQTASAQITIVYAKRCVVPKVAGLSLSRAEAGIKAAGCQVGRIEREHASVAKGHVVGTKPPAGKKRKAGARVKLIVSSGP
jgi:hypothetical protein